VHWLSKKPSGYRDIRHRSLTHRGSTELQVRESTYHRYARAELLLLEQKSKILESRRRRPSARERRLMQDGNSAWSSGNRS
jgi:hypothetical protein